MTLEELKEMHDDFVLATDVAPVIHCDPAALRLTARSHPERLGFPVTVVGKIVHIPRLPFIRFVEGGREAE